MLSVFLNGWIGLTLAEIGIFSIGLVLTILLVWSGLVFGWLWRHDYKQAWWRGQFKRPTFRQMKLESWVMLVLIVGASVLFYLAPHETMAGSQDSGVYYATGANIVRSGGLLNHDPLLQGVWDTSQDPAVGSKIIPQVLQGPAKQENRALFSRHLRLPGFFVPNNEDGLAAGQVVAQGFHLFPTYLAFGYALFGVRGESLVTPLFGILAIFAVYLTALRLFPTRKQRWIAPVATLLLMLNGIQVWFARESLWETLGEFLTFTAIYSFCLIGKQVSQTEPAEETTEPNLSILGGFGVGAAMGLICLAHAQFPFLVWVLPPYFLWMRLTRRWGAAQWWMLISFGLLFCQAVLHIRLFSLAYWEYTFHNVIIEGRYRLNWYIPGGTVLLFALIFIDAQPQRVLAVERWIVRHWKIWAGGLALISLAYTIYSYFILVYNVSVDQHSHYPDRHWSLSSYIGAPTTEGPERNLLRLGWYFSPVGMVLVFIGLAWLLWKRLNGKTAFLLAIMAGITLLFLDTNYTQENYIYSLRRYAVVTVPAFSIFMAYALFEAFPDWAAGLNRLVGSRRRVKYARAQAAGAGGGVAFAVLPVETAPVPITTDTPTVDIGKPKTNWGFWLGVGLTIVLVGFMAWTGKTIYTLSEYGAGDGQPGLIAQFDALANQFGPKDVLLFAGDRDPDGKIATPLTYIYGHPAFVLTDAVKNDEVAALIAHWESQGYDVKAMLGPNGGRFAPTGYALNFQNSVTLQFRQFEELDTQKPYNIQLNSLSYAIYDVQKVGQNASFALSAGQGEPNNATGWNLSIGQNDYAALVDGFYQTEKDPDNTAFRWTAQSGVLRVPCMAPDGASGKLSVTLSAGQRPANLGPVTVSVYLSNYRYADENGKRVKLGAVQLTNTPQTFTLDIPAGDPLISCARSDGTPALNSLVLWLSNEQPNTFVPSQSDPGSPDGRQLSFKVYNLKLASGQ